MVCCGSWCLKELDTTEWLTWTELNSHKWKNINSPKINFEVKRITLFCTIFHSFKIIFVSIVPFNLHSSHVKWSRLSCPFFRGEYWMSKQVSGLPMSANPLNGSASCFQMKNSSWVKYTFQNLAKNLLKNRYFSRRKNNPTLISINFKIFKNKTV